MLPTEPLRPLMIVPDFDRVGGYERQAFALSRRSVAAGVPTLLVTNNPWGHPLREERDGVTIHRLNPMPAGRTNWFSVVNAFTVFLTAHRRDFDVVHCHAFTFLSGWCVWVGRMLGKPTLVKVATEQDLRSFRARRHPAYAFFWRRLRKVDRLLCLSESIRSEAVRCGFRAERTALVSNGVDTEIFAPATDGERAASRRAHGIADGEFAFAFVGRLVQRKGVDVLLDAFAGVETPARLFVVGDGEQGSALRARAAELGLADRVTFTGELADVRPLLRGCDAFVFPSRLEGLPNALLEAISCGMPAIATRIGGCEDVLSGGAGVLVPPDDAPALAGAMDSLARDPALRARLAAAGRERALERFSFDRLVPELQSLYRELST